MDESNETSSVESSDYVTDEEESGGSSSENGTERLKLEGKEDRISALPDSVIQHIISLLPSTKQAIRTGILSKRWQHQWCRVPVLIFDSIGTDVENLSQFIDRTLVLHDCSKLKKFEVDIRYCYYPRIDPQLTSKLRFATRKHVEELILLMHDPSHGEEKLHYKLPEFLGRNDALVKLDLIMCHFHHHWMPYWPSLKELKLECSSLRLTAIENAVAGCPSLELLQLTSPHFENCVIASKSLRRLVIMDCRNVAGSDPVSILCPNLEELCIKISEILKDGFSFVPYKTIENVLSCSPMLISLELQNIASSSDPFVIASESLKKLVLGKFYNTSGFEILCPRLEEANLFDFKPAYNSSRRLAMKMLLQLQHVKLLELGCWFIKYLSTLEVKGQSALALQCKCLTLEGTNFDKFLPGFMVAIRSSRNLENLMMKFSHNEMFKVKKFYGQHPFMEPPFLNKCIKKDDICEATVFNCVVSNLKTVKIVVIPDLVKDDIHKLVFSFIGFVLKNSPVLERIVIVIAICGTSFTVGVSKRLLGFQRCYPHVSIDLCYAYH